MEIGARVIYGAAAGGAFAFFLIASVAPAAGEIGLRVPRWVPRFGARSYAVALALVLGLFRWPAIFDPRNVGVDEPMRIAGVMTLFNDPVFWRSVDGYTGGPLIYYVLMPLKAFGLLDYAGIKIVATLLLGGAVWFSYVGCRAVWGDALARLCVLPAACFFAFETRLDFLAYSSEHVPVLLLAMGFCGLFCCMARPENFSPWSVSWLGAGVALGAVPFGKLQGVPLAGVLIVAALAWAGSRGAWSARARLQAAAIFAAAVCIVPAAFLAMIAVSVRWDDFWIPYFAQSAARAGTQYGGGQLSSGVAWRFVLHGTLFKPLFFGACLVAGIALGVGSRARIFRQWPLPVLAGLAAASVVAGLLPAYMFHHLLFLVLPLTLLAGGLVACRLKNPAPRHGGAGWQQRGWLALFLIVLVVPLLGALRTICFGHEPDPDLARQGEFGPMAREIVRRARPDDRLAVWTGQSQLHVLTGLPFSVREANPRMFIRGRYRDYFQRRYLEDLERNRPRFFVDDVSAQPADSELRARLAHEAVPRLRDYVMQHYDYLGEFEGMRLYLRKGADS